MPTSQGCLVYFVLCTPPPTLSSVMSSLSMEFVWKPFMMWARSCGQAFLRGSPFVVFSSSSYRVFLFCSGLILKRLPPRPSTLLTHCDFPPPSQRDAIKKTHHATALQNKIALEADKMRKEMAKNARKTTKGERKR